MVRKFFNVICVGLRHLPNPFDCVPRKDEPLVFPPSPRTVEDAFRQDWAAIGGDFRRACDRFEREYAR